MLVRANVDRCSSRNVKSPYRCCFWAPILMWSMNRSTQAIVRCIFRNLLSISNRMNVTGGSVTVRFTVRFFVSGSCSAGVGFGWLGQGEWIFCRNGGPVHHWLQWRISLGWRPRESTSAGLSSVLTYLHSMPGVKFCISMTRLQTKVFNLLGSVLIQVKAVVESDQRVILEKVMFKLCVMLEINRASTSAPHSSRRAVVSLAFLRGATRDLEVSNWTEQSSLLLTERI